MTDEEADRLARDNLDLIDRVMVANRSSWHYLERSDLWSAGLEGLNAAIQSYKPGKKATFSTWAIYKIEWAIKSFVRKEARQRKIQLQLVQPRKKNYEIEPRRLSEKIENEATPCKNKDCGHPWFMHHPSPKMGCMHWDRRVSGSGFCQCDGFCMRIPVGQWDERIVREA